MSRLLRLAALVGALLFAQLAFALHGVEHLSHLDHDDGEVCLQCLALTGAAPVPTTAKPAPMRLDAAPAPSLPGVSPRLTFAQRCPFHSRAPPRLQR